MVKAFASAVAATGNNLVVGQRVVWMAEEQHTVQCFGEEVG